MHSLPRGQAKYKSMHAPRAVNFSRGKTPWSLPRLLAYYQTPGYLLFYIFVEKMNFKNKAYLHMFFKCKL
jgi:hypothetical protein